MAPKSKIGKKRTEKRDDDKSLQHNEGGNAVPFIERFPMKALPQSDEQFSGTPLHAETDRIHMNGTDTQNSTMPRNDSGHIPLLSNEEALALTVQIDDVETALIPMLEAQGCAIVAGIANEEECRRLESLFAEDLADVIDDAALSQAKSAVQNVAKKVAEDAKAWPEASMKILGNIDRCQLRGLPHGRFAWECRLLPNVRRCYEVVHRREDLVSSCDNPFFSPSTQREQHTNRSWPHVDQNIHDSRFFDDEGTPAGKWDVYQGILYVWSSQGSCASTTVVLPGSHRDAYDKIMTDSYMKKRGSKGTHFTQLSTVSKCVSDILQEQWRVGARRVPVPRGGLFLWSSRTLHQGWNGGPRLAQPVCWEPRPRRHDLAWDCKLRLAALGLPSTHWASLGIPHTLVKSEPCKVTEASCSGDQIRLPARASIHPISLRPEIDVAEMWQKLAALDWQSSLPDDVRDFVISCFNARILDAL